MKFTKFLILLLALSMLLVSCGGDGDGAVTTKPDVTTEATGNTTSTPGGTTTVPDNTTAIPDGITLDSTQTPPDQTQNPNENYEIRYNASQPIQDTRGGKKCSSLVARFHVIRKREEHLLKIEISSDQPLLDVVALGRSLPWEEVDGKRIFTLVPDTAESIRLNDGTSFAAQLYFEGDTIPTICVTNVYNTHIYTEEGVPNPNMEARRLLFLGEINELPFFPVINALPELLHFAGEVEYIPESEMYVVYYSNSRRMTVKPTDWKFEELMEFYMENDAYSDIELYTYRGINYYIIESWPTCGGVSEEEHQFYIYWENKGHVYELHLAQTVTSHEEAREAVHKLANSTKTSQS